MPELHANTDVKALVERHTLFPALTYFFTPSQRSLALHNMLEGEPISLSQRLGLSKSNAFPQHGLMACEQCVVQDRERYGSAHWHLEHLCPGVYSCHIHGSLLHAYCFECDAEVKRVNKSFRLPELRCTNPRHNRGSYMAPMPEVELAAFSKTIALLNSRPGGFDGDWKAQVKLFLYSAGFGKRNSLDLSKLTSHINCALSRNLKLALGFTGKEKRWVSILLHSTVPARPWSSIALALSFASSYDDFERMVMESRNRVQKAPAPSMSIAAVAREIETPSKETGLSTSAIFHGRFEASLPTLPAHKKRIMDLIAALVRSGYGFKSIQKRLGIRRSHIDESLRAAADMRSKDFLMKRAQFRNTVEAYISSGPSACNRSLLLLALPAEAKWLRTYDRTWYEKAVPNGSLQPRYHFPFTKTEDRNLARRIETVANDLRASGGPRRVTKKSILLAIRFSWRERKLTLKMPLSSAALNAGQETQVQYMQRKAEECVTSAGAKYGSINLSRAAEFGASGSKQNTTLWATILRAETKKQGFRWLETKPRGPRVIKRPRFNYESALGKQ